MTSRAFREPTPELAPLAKARARTQRLLDSSRHSSQYEDVAEARDYHERRARWNNEIAFDDAGISRKFQAGGPLPPGTIVLLDDGEDYIETHTRQHDRGPSPEPAESWDVPFGLGIICLAAVLALCAWVCARAWLGLPIGVGGL